jgi:uncharacterized protein (DUF362 family)/Pyruvate/2-oxoacid:ferredoxin oxidoreductase delta subunit
LAASAPEQAVTVHPAVFHGLAEWFRQSGASLYFGDSPGKGKPERVARRCGIQDVADQLNIPLADFRTVVRVAIPQAKIAKQLPLAASLLDMDGIISISKMKTHALTRITGAVKNQFGYIPGILKGEFHVKMPNIYDFSTVLVDITKAIKPRLFVMDGIVAMEGNGPRGGDPRPMEVLLFSRDPVALDTVFCKLIRLNPDLVPFLPLASDLGLGIYDETKIEIVGDGLDALIQNDFKVIRKKPDLMISARHFPPFLKSIISPKPVIDRAKCTHCGSCVIQCPVRPRAVNWHPKHKDAPPIYDYRACIRCYCCQEICPSRAISVKTPLLGKLIHR